MPGVPDGFCDLVGVGGGTMVTTGDRPPPIALADLADPRFDDATRDIPCFLCRAPSTSTSTSSWPTIWSWSAASTMSPGLPTEQAAEASMRAFVRAHPRGRFGGIEYEVAPFGLDRHALREAISFSWSGSGYAPKAELRRSQPPGA